MSSPVPDDGMPKLVPGVVASCSRCPEQLSVVLPNPLYCSQFTYALMKAMEKGWIMWDGRMVCPACKEKVQAVYAAELMARKPCEPEPDAT